jgi:hypothetical protein
MLPPGNGQAEALARLEEALGLRGDTTQLIVVTPIGDVSIQRTMLPHIVEKRINARERFTRFAIETMRAPYEVWSVVYNDESLRYAFIGLFNGKTQMLVVVTVEPERTLWNFMNCDKKTLNKHRHGKRIFPKPE